MQFYLITAAAVLSLDRLTKHWVKTNMDVAETIPVIEGFFHITFIKNSGAAFGMFADSQWIFIAVTFILLLVIVYLAARLSKKEVFLSAVLGMITGGAVGNLIDRIRTGLVIDFIDFRGIWPYIFNAADSFLVIGVFLLTWHIIKSDRIL